MKKFSVFFISLIFLAAASSAFAKTYSYPAGKPTFSIDFPDTWKVELDSQDVAIVAQSPDKEIEYNLWVLPSKDVKENVKDALNEAVKEANEIVAHYVTDVSFGDWKSDTVNGVDFISAEGQGKYKDGGQTVYMEVAFFSPDSKAVYALIYWGTKEGEKKYKSEIEKIDASIKKVK